MVRKARARMLAPTISTSERVNMLSLKAALLYTWMLAHADDQGRLTGVPTTIKALVVPLREDLSVEDVDRVLNEMEDLELIRRYSAYEVGGWKAGEDDRVIQINDWWDYQHLRDPQPSKYPAPKGWRDKVGKQSRDEQGQYRREE
jgi:hypothetical protein